MKIDWECVMASTIGITCTLSILGGGTAVLVGGGARMLIWAGDSLKAHQNTLDTLAYWGGISVGSGLFAFGGAAATAKFLGDRQAMHQWERERAAMTPVACKGCRYYHGHFYYGEQGTNRLICSIHPYGCESENCPDFHR